MRFFEFGKEMGRKFLFLFVWEGKGKEIISISGLGRKGKEKIAFLFMKKMGRTK